MMLRADGFAASSKTLQVNASMVKNADLNPGIDPSIFHKANPAFPFLLPGKSAPLVPESKSMFNRVCFRFIYAITVNVTENDDATFFYQLFERQCVGGDKNKCSRWSDDLLQAVRKKMGTVKLLGKDGHIGRHKKKNADEALEARLPPTLSGITSYANWCNELHKDLIAPPSGNDSAMRSTTQNASKAFTLKVDGRNQVNTTNATAQVTQSSQTMEKKTQVIKAAEKIEKTTQVTKGSQTLSKNKKEVQFDRTKTKVPAPVNATRQEDGCYCFHRGSKKTCHCDEVRQSSKPNPFKNVATKLKGAGIAEQVSEAASNERDLDDVEVMMHNARSAAERRVHKRQDRKDTKA
jgi:hypothetical protein